MHNNGINAEPPIARFQVEHQSRRPGYAKRYATERERSTMVDWLFANVFYALVIPLILVFATACIILGLGAVRPIRLARDFQVCLYCTALLGATKYDVNMALRDAPDDQLREMLTGAATLDYGLLVALLVSAFFYGVSACMPYFSHEDPESLERDKLIVVASACSVGMTVLFVVMARIQAGLL